MRVLMFQNLRAFYPVVIIALITCFTLQGNAQDPTRFEQEIRDYLEESPIKHDSNLIVFTGSSSIRFWTDLKDAFPNHNVVNRGFGGSHMSDLDHYLDDLVLKHKPSMVLIYEGDNDIADGEMPGDILKEAVAIVDRLRASDSTMTIAFISPKPSIARWNLRSEYKRYNQMLEDKIAELPGVWFIDVWKPMLVRGRMLREDLFIGDGLHMNDAGYEIWREAILPYLPAQPTQ